MPRRRSRVRIPSSAPMAPGHSPGVFRVSGNACEYPLCSRSSESGRGGMADAAVLKTAEGQPSCGFESRRPHQKPLSLWEICTTRESVDRIDRFVTPQKLLEIAGTDRHLQREPGPGLAREHHRRYYRHVPGRVPVQSPDRAHHELQLKRRQLHRRHHRSAGVADNPAPD